MDWFISDTHFHHKGVIQYSNRPYDNVLEMDIALMDNWNKVVSPKDTVYHIGDFSFGNADKIEAVVKRLKGNIHLILGNHDETIRRKKHLQSLFASVQEYKFIKIPDSNHEQGKQRMALFHYAMRVWDQSHYGSWQIFGHSHGTLKEESHLCQMDVGVDATRLYRPISYEEVKEYMKTKTYKPVDHHGDRAEVISSTSARILDRYGVILGRLVD